MITFREFLQEEFNYLQERSGKLRLTNISKRLQKKIQDVSKEIQRSDDPRVKLDLLAFQNQLIAELTVQNSKRF